MFKAAATFFKGLSPTMQIVVIIIIIIVVYLLYRKFSSQISSFFQSRKITYQTGENAGNQGYTAGGGDPTKGKSFLEDLSNNIYSDIYDTPIEPSALPFVPYAAHDASLYKIADSLTDSDLFYMADFYKTYLTKGTSLYKDMDGEYYIGDVSSYADSVKGKLLKVGAK